MTGAVLSPGAVGCLFGLLRGLFFFHGFCRRFLGLFSAVHPLAHGLCSFEVRGEEIAALFLLIHTIHQSRN